MTERQQGNSGRTRSNGRVAVICLGVVAAMTGLSYASVPLYELFCRVTGYGGTTQVAESLPEQVGERIVTVRFNADVNPELPWAFQPVERAVTLQVGESGLAFYRATNQAARTTAGTATFNVTPLKAGQYFNKVECFCFTEQRLAPGESMDMAVSFFVDPAIEEDPNLDDVKTITLSYTFFVDPDAVIEEPQASLRPEEAAAGAGQEPSVN
ncbi:cytochrome c oxidase assembly protein [Pelagibius sp.]|uniref:cytochrome c oxidase assembly protein n=1 Tax=Pelagibius sp. TaxID=1931238 RepID=UPI00263A3171|nr:cytochrome c oxidase assembly protein [Pelagibius sp.]